MSVDHKLQEKLNNLQKLEINVEQIVNLSSRIDITVQPHQRGASFPYHDYTPFCQQLTKQQLLDELGYVDQQNQN
jgi:hypothetical protein